MGGAAGEVATILHRLRENAVELTEAPAVSQIDRDLSVVTSLTYGELWHRTVQGACRLRSLTRKGDRALIFFEPGILPSVPFWASLLAGILAVPAALPSKLDSSAALDTAHRYRALLRLMQDCGPRLVLCSRARQSEVEEFCRLVESPPQLVAIEDFWEGQVDGRVEPSIVAMPEASEIAFLQYTSGSTSQPKGVVVTHGNLVHNQMGIERALGLRRGATLVGWLPLFHDMGLVGDAMQCVWAGAHNVKMLPADFLRRPHRWMEAVDRFRARITGGPNFAFQSAAAAAARVGAQLDLSCLRTLYCGSEPIRKSTLDRFVEAYRPHGFDPEVLRPCYGLAEHALIVTGWRPEGPYRTRRARSSGGIRGSGEPVVSCGALPWNDVKLEILEPGTEMSVPEGCLGEIVVRSRSVSPGYWSELGRTAGRHPVQERTLRTGDIGFLQDGDLHVEGRLKNTLILNGRKVVAEDVEAELELGLGRVQRVRAAVVQTPGVDRDCIVVLLEGSIGPSTEWAGVEAQVFEICSGLFGFRPDAVELLRPSTLPRTTSGKLQRQRAGELWQERTQLRQLEDNTNAN